MCKQLTHDEAQLSQGNNPCPPPVRVSTRANYVTCLCLCVYVFYEQLRKLTRQKDKYEKLLVDIRDEMNAVRKALRQEIAPG